MYYGVRSFAERYEDFKKLNAELVGLSIDSTFSHIRWIEWIQEKLGVGIPLPIVADPRGEVADRLGLLHAQSATRTARAVFIVDVVEIRGAPSSTDIVKLKEAAAVLARELSK